MSKQVIEKSPELLLEVINVLISNLSNRRLPVKVKWNAAYAIGNVFRNTEIALCQLESTSHALRKLCEALVTEPNFKVSPLILLFTNPGRYE